MIASRTREAAGWWVRASSSCGGSDSMLRVENQNRNYEATASRAPIENERIMRHVEPEKRLEEQRARRRRL